MLRKMLIASALAALGLVTTGGVAVADLYPADDVASVAVDDALIVPGETVAFSGGGFTPGETIDITVTFDGAGLRSSLSPAFAAEAVSQLAKEQTVADSAGRFTIPLTLTQVGVYTLTATGLTSGISLSKSVTVSTSANTTYTSTAAAGSGSSTDAGGLAYTGASIAGPLIVGGLALVIGLGMLFFGARMAIRRKHTPIA